MDEQVTQKWVARTGREPLLEHAHDLANSRHFRFASNKVPEVPWACAQEGIGQQGAHVGVLAERGIHVAHLVNIQGAPGIMLGDLCNWNGGVAVLKGGNEGAFQWQGDPA